MSKFDLEDYEPVASRVQRFYDGYPEGAIHTEIVFDDGKRIVVKASVYRHITDHQPAAVDFAEEYLSDRGVNSTSRIENACTSAIGRAISVAAAGLGPSDWTKKPTREEMKKVQRMTEPSNFTPPADGQVIVKGPQHGPLPQWLIDAATAENIYEVYDNRDRVGDTKRPWFKAVQFDKAFWPPRGNTALPVVPVTPDDVEEPF